MFTAKISPGFWFGLAYFTKFRITLNWQYKNLLLGHTLSISFLDFELSLSHVFTFDWPNCLRVPSAKLYRLHSSVLFPRWNQLHSNRRGSWARRAVQQFFNQFIRYLAQNNAENRFELNKLRKKNFEISKKLSELTKENEKIKNFFLQAARNQEGQLACHLCGIVFFTSRLGHTRRSVILPYYHFICYNCAQTRAAECRMQAFNQAPTCPRCNFQYNQNQLQYIQL